MNSVFGFEMLSWIFKVCIHQCRKYLEDFLDKKDVHVFAAPLVTMMNIKM